MKKSLRLGLRVTKEDKDKWAKQATNEGISLSAWLTKLANERISAKI